MVLLLCGVLEGTAAAQSSLVLSLGKLYGGDVKASSKTFGIALGGTGAHSIGSELEYSQTSQVTDLSGHVSKVLSLMAGVMVPGISGSRPAGGIFGCGLSISERRPSKGFVLSNLSNNDVGYNAGGGVIYKFSRGAGVRLDLRHFKVRKAGGLSFQRLMVGIVLGG